VVKVGIKMRANAYGVLYISIYLGFNLLWHLKCLLGKHARSKLNPEPIGFFSLQKGE